MPLSQLVLPSFTLVLSDSVTLRDFQRAQTREIHIPVHAPLSDEEFMHTIDLRDTTPASAFITYKCTYYPDQDAASLFGDENGEELASDGHFWRRLLLKVKGFGGRFFAGFRRWMDPTFLR
ncbi:uncharacterized protein LACBIDRAFT_321066 [Laccaria bicolor S238N-H82]|uniref:Predicted protein n=1 Tax=Laccaria bicolor (strain S238N-H82 / ATCC MYA-4686) TaxID=486041 RepID=B0CNN0_LACBS|nr:uncharacterized protein LACBIDRAFT_291806 [Laccaria bicolor S238N-H82]XP_001874172.1 uncharacterized protein LACBIDRAFT_321066 [Laccaria bicolor S238N-H82]EDR15961.1 predicted protein [Laccaria bicolor S238N-H82]EDR15964.1 predicted protein [Laccaria bicolor S238N-H82]|eukprot:XP_001874169.1 predicted protein [Laccaria bicolor S238N-H82]